MTNRIPLESIEIRDSFDDDDTAEISSDSDVSIDLDVFLRDLNNIEMELTGRYEEDGKASVGVTLERTSDQGGRVNGNTEVSQLWLMVTMPKAKISITNRQTVWSSPPVASSSRTLNHNFPNLQSSSCLGEPADKGGGSASELLHNSHPNNALLT